MANKQMYELLRCRFLNHKYKNEVEVEEDALR